MRKQRTSSPFPTPGPSSRSSLSWLRFVLSHLWQLELRKSRPCCFITPRARDGGAADYRALADGACGCVLKCVKKLLDTSRHVPTHLHLHSAHTTMRVVCACQNRERRRWASLASRFSA